MQAPTETSIRIASVALRATYRGWEASTALTGLVVDSIP